MSAWVVASNVVSPLGMTSEENYAKIRKQISGLSTFSNKHFSNHPIHAGYIDDRDSASEGTRFERLCRKATNEALRNKELNRDKTLYILSTTKGNIELLNDENGTSVLSLSGTAKQLAAEIGVSDSLVISNACISGVMALIVGKRFLDSKKYDHVIVVGADVLSHFVISGFESLKALSPDPCRPFDALRNGINLGEAASVIILSAKPEPLAGKMAIKITGGGLSNDANHISGPSRTGEELKMAISKSLKEAGKSPIEIDFISAHGTATIFNDEMEAKAFNLMKMETLPLHSLKGYFGHTLGAAGVVESAMSIQSLLNNEIITSKGYERSGVSLPVNVCTELISKELTTCIKTASGFGGCNAAIVFQKEYV